MVPYRVLWMVYIVCSFMCWRISYQDVIPNGTEQVDIVWMIQEQTEFPGTRLHSINNVVKNMKVGMDIYCGFMYYGALPSHITPLSPALTLAADDESKLVPTGSPRPLIALINAKRLFRMYGRTTSGRYLVILTDNLNNFDDECVRFLLRLAEQNIRILVRATGKYFHYGNNFEKRHNDDIQMYDSEKSLLNDLHTISEKIARDPIDASNLHRPVVDMNSPENSSEICRQAFYSEGIGYLAHPYDCGAVFECLPNRNGYYTEHLRLCGFGQSWDENLLSCRKENLLTCKHDNCQFENLISSPKIGTCRSYYLCVGGHSVSSCCEIGNAYNASIGCVPEVSCIDECAPRWGIESKVSCNKRGVLGRPHSFEEFSKLTQEWLENRCPFNGVFSDKLCGCVPNEKSDSPDVYNECQPVLNLTFCDGINDRSTHRTAVINEGNRIEIRKGKAYFNGFSKLVVPAFAGKDLGDTLFISFKYKIAMRKDLSMDENRNSDFIDANNVEDSLLDSQFAPMMSLITNARCDGDVFDPGPCQGEQSISYMTSYFSTKFEAETYNEGISLMTKRNESMDFDQDRDEFDDREAYYEEFMNGDSSTDCAEDSWDHSWHNVSILIQDGRVTIAEDNHTHSGTLSGTLRISDEGLQIGQGDGLLGFQGYLDEILVYLCKPDQVEEISGGIQKANADCFNIGQEETKGKNMAGRCGSSKMGKILHSVKSHTIVPQYAQIKNKKTEDNSHINLTDINTFKNDTGNSDSHWRANKTSENIKTTKNQHITVKNYIFSNATLAKKYTVHSIKKDTDLFYDKSKLRTIMDRTTTKPRKRLTRK